jgi:hypothetical protein
VARELIAGDLVGHNPYPGQPAGLEGHDWAVAMVRRAFLAEVWHQEDAPGMLRQLGLEPPPAIMRLAARRSAHRYRRQRHAIS